MTCRETRPLLPLFFDGELEARQMRSVALHSTRCTTCEQELRELEHLQEAVASHVSALVDEVDLSRVWAGVAPRLAPRAPSLLGRWRAWWEEHRLGWGLRGPAYAGAAAAALLALLLIQPTDVEKTPASTAQVAPRAKIDNSAKLDSMQSSVDSVALVTDAETNTTLLWIMDDAGGVVEPVSDEWDSLE
ncbi:MAG: hypothetical protein SF182_15560 [Deltaproteobacteria bacterium]|nr:hypothetical protein [Deltaproteobacteria bacterium]